MKATLKIFSLEIPKNKLAMFTGLMYMSVNVYANQLNNTYNLLFCIGNSVVHLNNNEEILEFLEKCKNSLKSGGHLGIQIVNYDRILAKDVKSLPLIDNEEMDLRFERYYDYLPEKHKMDFKTILKVNHLSLGNHVLLHPVRSEELVGLLEKSGFINIRTYGSFKKDEYDSMNSFPLVIGYVTLFTTSAEIILRFVLLMA